MNRTVISWSVLMSVLLIPVFPGFVPAQSASELLEKGIYTEETVGDLQAAIAIYDRIVKDARTERPHVARALYRLGLCYGKAGQTEAAEKAFRALVQDYAEQTELVDRARQHLPGLTWALPALDPAPWIDGEQLQFTVDFPGGDHLGDMSFSAFTRKAKGQTVWRLESCLGCPLHGISKFMSVEARQDDFLPLRAYLYHTTIGQARSEFVPGLRKMVLNRPGGKPEPSEQKLTHPVFDNEQNVFVLRRLPLGPDFETDIPFAGRPDVTFTAHVKVEGRENVTVPAGVFDCWRVTLSAAGRTETSWVSADKHRYLVKSRSPDATIRLTGMGRRAIAATTFRADEYGVTWRVPEGWQVIQSPKGTRTRHGFAQMFAPELEVWGMFYRVPAGDETAGQRAEKQMAGMKQKVRGYQVREGSYRDAVLPGLDAVSFLADLTLRGWPMSEHQTCIRVGPTIYIVVFVSLRENQEHYRKAVNDVIASLCFDRT